METANNFVCPEGYKFQQTLDLGNCRANIYVPDLSPEDEEKRMNRIKAATAEFMAEVYQERALKQKHTKEQNK